MKTRAIAVAAVLLLALTGCAGTADDAGDANAAPETSANAAPTTTETLVAESPAELDGEEAEAAYLTAVRERLAKIQSQIPNATDDQLIAAAEDACERLSAGESSETMSLIEGETISEQGYYSDSGAIISAARLTLCPSSTE